MTPTLENAGCPNSFIRKCPTFRVFCVVVTYHSLDLLRVFYLEYMVDRTTFLSWLVQMIGSCNLAQADFMARLADDFFSDMGSCRALVKPFIDACLAKLQEVMTSWKMYS